MPYSSTQIQGITDLTVLADIKPGLVTNIFDSKSYTWRLTYVLRLLDAARRASREADLAPNPFADAVGRLRGIHFFRFAVVPPGDRLLLNVTFDGGWEPYMRLIWGPLGTMLDLIFCHCVDYPQAASSSYDDYIAWVRRHELPSQFFYADSGGTVADRLYLNRVDSQLQSGGGRNGLDLQSAQMALDPGPPTPATSASVTAAIRTLKGLHGLIPFFGPPGPGWGSTVNTDDGSVLLRFAQEFLPELREWVAQGLFDAGQRFDVLRPTFEAERQWLMKPRWTRPGKKDPAFPVASAVQAGILAPLSPPKGHAMRGAVLLARITDAGAARGWLANAVAQGIITDGTTSELEADQVACTVAFTYSGMQALKMSSALADLPVEFTQGMEARAGILGDLRANHPQQWKRPVADWQRPDGAPRAPIDFSVVHLVVQLRTPEGEKEIGSRETLLDRLRGWIDAQFPATTDTIASIATTAPTAKTATTAQSATTGIEVLTVQPTWSRPAAEPAALDHFGFADGISQPNLTPSAARLYWDDVVKTGEVLLGWVNERGDGPPAAAPPAQQQAARVKPTDLGTFLVVRKIRQYVDRFDAIVERTADALVSAGIASALPAARELVRAKLVGRHSDGTALVARRGTAVNDFDYRHDADGSQCPFASHVRRANPRTKQAPIPTPRIVRRGMAYGTPREDEAPETASPAAERGVLFMAYNASIAEQFEVIQRWLTGGNSSGVSSSQADPLLRVPQAGELAVFRFSHEDRVVRVELGDQPVCSLEWGLYAFVPSIALLRDVSEPPATKAPPGESAVEPLPEGKLPRDQVKADFEDELRRRERWAAVRAENGVRRIRTVKGPAFVMVGHHDRVLDVLGDDGSTYSVCGYGQRMAETLGPSPFGQDDAVAPGAAAQSDGHNRPYVAAVKEAIGKALAPDKAFGDAQEVVATRLRGDLANAARLGASTASVEWVALGTHMIAELCARWFGVVYEAGVTERGGLGGREPPVRCPGHLLSVARYVFSAEPHPTVQELATAHGEALKPWVGALVDAAAGDASPPIRTAVLDALKNEPNLTADDRKGILANVMLGLPATVLGSWHKLLRAWTADRTLWQMQYELQKRSVAPQGLSAADARSLLHDPVVTALRADPVADGIWRTVKQKAMLDATAVEPGDVVWLGLGSALSDPDINTKDAKTLLFGGPAGKRHACPGREIALGMLMGGVAALLQAGELAPTASPTVLALKRLSAGPG